MERTAIPSQPHRVLNNQDRYSKPQDNQTPTSEKVSVFVASNNKKAWSWFEENAPADWQACQGTTLS
jgi:hypothetical protein